jgi:hypothetical protein
MSPELLFTFSNILVLPFWVLMILLPRWAVTQRIISSPLIALPTALLYAALVLPQAGSLLGTLANPSLGDIAKLLGTPQAALIAWAHFVTFDLLAGRWAYLESRTRNYRALVMAPVLFFILMLGPFGFLLYLIVRAGYSFVRERNTMPQPARA